MADDTKVAPTPKVQADGVIEPPAPSATAAEVATYATGTTKGPDQPSAVVEPPAAKEDLTSLQTRPKFPSGLTLRPVAEETDSHPLNVPSLAVTHYPTVADGVAFAERMAMIMGDAMVAAHGHPGTPSGRVGLFVEFLRDLVNHPG